MKNYRYNTVRPEDTIYRDSVISESDLGVRGTQEYAMNVKKYFNLGDVDIDKLSVMPDQQKAYHIFSEWSDREEKILSGQYFDERLTTTEENFKEFVKNYLGGNEADLKYINDALESSGDKKIRILSDIGKIMKDYYGIIKALAKIGDEDAMIEESDTALGRVFDVFDDWGL